MGRAEYLLLGLLTYIIKRICVKNIINYKLKMLWLTSGNVASSKLLKEIKSMFSSLLLL